MPRYRFQGIIYRADDESMHEAHSYDSYVDMEQTHDITIPVKDTLPIVITLANYGLANISDLVIFTDQELVVTINDQDILVREMFILKDTTITTSITITNTIPYSTAEVRLIFGGPEIAD